MSFADLPYRDDTEPLVVIIATRFSGQPRPYADTYYVWDVTFSVPRALYLERIALGACQVNVPPEESVNKRDPNQYFRGWYDLKWLDDHTIRIQQTRPYDD